ncbi:tyrosine-type recombinase/integrase [Acidovorax radicis]|uniref:tyrosine-type recombinase/integrase n=1 Tax=Acidovorax radicis TaxID=758826 RepID=UPI001CF99EC6|nr:site-specific integrase [Acidovorax radicis]UCV00246.1 site-specific integrase [Acidovorax radicis]
MSIYKDKERGCYVFEFSRRINGERVRATKALPQTWTRAQADAYDRSESARLYATATGVTKPERSVEDAVACYLTERAPKLKQGANVERELALIYWVYQGRKLSELPEVCKEYAQKAVTTKGEPLAPASIRNRIRYLTAACRYAWKQGYCEHDPGARVVVPEVKNERQHYADRATMLTIARACTNRKARMAIRIAFYSGMRLSEILRARPVGGVWMLDDTKNGQPRHVPIHPRVAVCARRFVPGPKITIQWAWSKARDATGNKHLHFHDLRHSTASAMLQAGVELYTIGKVLGHKDSRSTQRYSHLSTDALTSAVRKIG